jgi:hypothetical protein
MVVRTVHDSITVPAGSLHRSQRPANANRESSRMPKWKGCFSFPLRRHSKNPSAGSEHRRSGVRISSFRLRSGSVGTCSAEHLSCQNAAGRQGPVSCKSNHCAIGEPEKSASRQSVIGEIKMTAPCERACPGHCVQRPVFDTGSLRHAIRKKHSARRSFRWLLRSTSFSAATTRFPEAVSGQLRQAGIHVVRDRWSVKWASRRRGPETLLLQAR